MPEHEYARCDCTPRPHCAICFGEPGDNAPVCRVPGEAVKW